MHCTCRHIKPSGLRCKSPALHGQPFCYFHAKVHGAPEINIYSDLKFPLFEDAAGIQLAISQVLQALLCSRIEPKRASQLLWGIQLASQYILRPGDPQAKRVKSVETLTQTEAGDDLAPVATVCDKDDICVGCELADQCPDYDPANR